MQLKFKAVSTLNSVPILAQPYFLTLQSYEAVIEDVFYCVMGFHIFFVFRVQSVDLLFLRRELQCSYNCVTSSFE